MRKLAFVAFGLLSLIVIGVVLVRGSRLPGVAKIDIEAPAHYFIPHATDDLDELSCVFDRGLERGSLHNIWSYPLQPCSLGRGWSNPGSSAVMAVAKRSTLSFFTDRTDWTYLALRLRAEPHPSIDRAQTMRIQLNRRVIGTVEVPNSWTTISLPVPTGFVRKGVNAVKLEYGYRAFTEPPRKRKPKGPLAAIYLREITLTSSDPKRNIFETLRRIVPFDSPTRESSGGQVYDRNLGRFVLSTAGTLVMPIALSDRIERIEVEAHSPATGDSDIGQITLNLFGATTGAFVSAPFSAIDVEGRRSVRASLPVSPLAGQLCVLWIDLVGPTEGAAIEFPKPQLISATGALEDKPTGGGRVNEEIDRPDIVLITLDAARPQHFSCYGYHRPTTPHIDRLGDESLIFTNAFALVPNTLRSVPTMITGLSFLNHLVTEDDSTLSDAATTLAEVLSDAGYRTACFSASPNNSRAIGDDQGYEEFFELWNEVPRKRSRDPHYLSGRVREWLTSFDDGRPLHLQLHLVPPHAPYTPAARFNRFSDPLYGGTIDGSTTQILELDRGAISFDENDMDHLISLYDGNLRAADDAVGEVLRTLRERSRWKDTVVLVTSDHGEAFFEHRRMGHNKTVFDEMLRVPFVLRLPDSVLPKVQQLDRLVTLADITPTLLAAASLESNVHSDGIDLVSEPLAGNGPDNRFFIARTADETPTRGLRTRRFKLILRNSGQGKLFDVVEDPGEQHNLRFSKPEVFVGLGLMLTRSVIEPPSLRGTTRELELPESDREMLEALGYIE